MREDDKVAVMSTRVLPTNRNRVFAIGEDMATEYRSKRQVRPTAQYSVTLTLVQKRMIAGREWTKIGSDSVNVSEMAASF
jgi:hypothetical protein